MLWVYFKLLHDIFQLCKLKYTVDQLYDATFFQRIFKKKWKDSFWLCFATLTMKWTLQTICLFKFRRILCIELHVLKPFFGIPLNSPIKFWYHSTVTFHHSTKRNNNNNNKRNRLKSEIKSLVLNAEDILLTLTILIETIKY